MKTIEKKYLIKKSPSNNKCIETIFIEQGYLSLEQDVYIRKETFPYRKKGNKEQYLLIIKKDDSVSVKKIQLATYLDLLKSIDGSLIEKLRKRYALDDGVIVDIDIFKSIPDIIIAEVEFKDLQQANDFVPPSWFGAEVTNNENFKNRNIAKL